MKSSQVVFLSTTQVLVIHDQMIKKFGGSMGVRNLGLLESSVARPQATFDGNDLYVTIFDKASVLLQSLLKNHPFIDGNKRTAITSSGVFLRLNGYRLMNHHLYEVHFALQVDTNNLAIEQITAWLKKHSEKISTRT